MAGVGTVWFFCGLQAMSMRIEDDSEAKENRWVDQGGEGEPSPGFPFSALGRFGAIWVGTGDQYEITMMVSNHRPMFIFPQDSHESVSKSRTGDEPRTILTTPTRVLHTCGRTRRLGCSRARRTFFFIMASRNQRKRIGYASLGTCFYGCFPLVDLIRKSKRKILNHASPAFSFITSHPSSHYGCTTTVPMHMFGPSWSAASLETELLKTVRNRSRLPQEFSSPSLSLPNACSHLLPK